MADLSRILPDLYGSNAVLVAFAFFVIGMSIKMALFPMHAWLPGAYADAPSAVSALVAATSTKVAVYVLVRVMFFVFEPRFSVEMIPVASLLAWMGAGAMVVGSVMAIAQTDFKRMLAYSSVAQIGYIVLGVGLANTMGFTGGILHLVNHAFMKGGLFLVAGAIVYRTGLRTISEFYLLSVKMPWTAATFTVCAFAMIRDPTDGRLLQQAVSHPRRGRRRQLDLSWWSSSSAAFSPSPIWRTCCDTCTSRRRPPPGRVGGRPVPEAIKRDDVPWTMLGPMLAMAAVVVLLGLFNGEVVGRFIDPGMPMGLER